MRGIGTVANQAGFEQAVSVNIDGVQTSRGRVVSQGFFDLQQVEVLKGPQALFFGKNSPAGVISLKSAGPTDQLEAYVSAGYEFRADEAYLEGAISGPITDTLGARLAVRGRNMKGWLRNFSQPSTGVLNTPGTSDGRPGEREILGRLTLEYKPTADFTATIKVFGSKSNDDGPSAGNLQITSCGTGTAPDLDLGFATFLDPTGDCLKNSHQSSGDTDPVVAANWPIANRKDGRAFGSYNSILASANLVWRLGDMSLTSTTGYYRNHASYFDNYDGTTYAIVSAAERDRFRSISQQIRLESDFSGPLNFMVGGYYGDEDHYYFNSSRIAAVPADPATGKYQSWERPASTRARTISAFGQLKFTSGDVEIAGGGRYTHESKNSDVQNTYVHPLLTGVFTTQLFTDRFRDDNFSPEVTAAWHPTSQSTIYVAYKTGYKSGGFALSANPTVATTNAELSFDSERVKGFEAGAKGDLFDRRLRAEMTVFRYRFSDLQVTSFDPATTAFTIQNVGQVKQWGAEAQLSYQLLDGLRVRGAVSYTKNRYGPFFGQCYSGQTAAQGCTPTGQDRTGRPTRGSPDWSGNMGISYDADLGNAKLGLTSDAYYSDGYFASETQSPYSYQPSFWRFDASARLSFDDDRYEVALIGRNLSNKYVLLFASDKPFSATGQQYGTTSRPRSVSLQFTARY